MRRAILGLILALNVPACDNSTAPYGTRCGPAVCPLGRDCCNASCGTCVAPGAACSLIYCGESPCSSDQDCRTFSFICTSCECWALRVGDPTPACPNPTIQCLVDPCLGRSARCDPATHRCAIQ